MVNSHQTEVPIVEYNQIKGENHMSKINPIKLASPTSLQDKGSRKQGRSNWTMVLSIAGWLVMIAVLAGCKSDSVQPTQVPEGAPPEMPAIDGAQLLETRCSVCHSVDRAKQAKKTHDEWDQTVTRMIGKGAQLTEEEKTVLVDYLAKTYGP
jgi:mono/diheme cytochrome c family protein